LASSAISICANPAIPPGCCGRIPSPYSALHNLKRFLPHTPWRAVFPIRPTPPPRLFWTPLIPLVFFTPFCFCKRDHVTPLCRSVHVPLAFACFHRVCPIHPEGLFSFLPPAAPSQHIQRVYSWSPQQFMRVLSTHPFMTGLVWPLFPFFCSCPEVHYMMRAPKIFPPPLFVFFLSRLFRIFPYVLISIPIRSLYFSQLHTDILRLCFIGQLLFFPAPSAFFYPRLHLS